MKKQRGFTLVELLVVIGIIALLIGILMPALGKARQNANRAACLANMHSLGLAIAMYTNQWKGTLPEGKGPLGLVDWTSLLAIQIGATHEMHSAAMDTADKVKSMKMFLCPDGKEFTKPAVTHYACHPLLMPDCGSTYPSGFPGVDPTIFRHPYKITKVPTPADIVLLYDSGQALGGTADGSAGPMGHNIDGNRLNSNGNLNGGVTTPGKTYLMVSSGVDLGKSVDGGVNRDGPPASNLNDVRWRHMGNTAACFLYVDGHAGSLRYNSRYNTELLRRNVYLSVGP